METPLASSHRLVDLVDYQDDSVVSRVVFRNAGGTMTAFAFAEGQGLSEHSNPNDAIVMVLEGRVRVRMGDADHDVGEGEALHLPAAVPHALIGGPPFKMLLTLLKKQS